MIYLCRSKILQEVKFVMVPPHWIQIDIRVGQCQSMGIEDQNKRIKEHDTYSSVSIMNSILLYIKCKNNTQLTFMGVECSYTPHVPGTYNRLKKKLCLTLWKFQKSWLLNLHGGICSTGIQEEIWCWLLHPISKNINLKIATSSLC